jgi:hypothetical protein
MHAQNPLDEALARARQDRLELTRLRARIGDARGDRERVAEQLDAARAAHAYRADGDNDLSPTGVAGWLRRLVAEVPDLSDAQQELAASALLCNELEDELRACNAYVQQLEARANAFGDVDARYAQLLATVEHHARADAALANELDELEVTQAELGASRFEIREAIELAIGLQQSSDRVTVMIRDIQSEHVNDELDVLIVAGMILTGTTAARYRELCAELARLHHGLRMFDQLCSQLTSLLPNSFAMTITPLPSTTNFVVRDAVGATGVLDPVLLELGRVSSMLVAANGELRQREAKVDRAIAECGEMRARLLERFASGTT